jgi:hypothetical protein
MPFCSNCGQPVGEYDKFCNKCGHALAPPPPPPNQQSTITSHYPPKPSTNLANGIIIGTGLVLLIVGLLIAFSLNSTYNQQVSYFAVEGIQVNPYAFFEGLVIWISTGFFMAILGAYCLVLGVINQFSATVRTAMNLKDIGARLGNGFITGGFILTALSTNNALAQYYRSTFTGTNADASIYFVMITVGLVLIVIGALLFVSAYMRSQHMHKQ